MPDNITDDLEPIKKLALITDIRLGFEEHGFLTCRMELKYTRGEYQGFGDYCLGGTHTDRWIRGLLDAVDVEQWKDIPGHYVYAIMDSDKWWGGKVIGIAPLPMNDGITFYAKGEDVEDEV